MDMKRKRVAKNPADTANIPVSSQKAAMRVPLPATSARKRETLAIGTVVRHKMSDHANMDNKSCFNLVSGFKFGKRIPVIFFQSNGAF